MLHKRCQNSCGGWLLLMQNFKLKSSVQIVPMFVAWNEILQCNMVGLSLLKWGSLFIKNGQNNLRLVNQLCIKYLSKNEKQVIE